MDSRRQEYASGTNSYHHWLKISIAALLTEVGFDKCEPMVLERLTEMSQGFLYELGRSARAYCELARRVEPLGADVLLALTEMGQSGPNGCNPLALLEHAMRSDRRALKYLPQTAVPPKETSILHTGDRRTDGRGNKNTNHYAVIPDYLPEFPDSHTYIRTPTHRHPKADYQSVREKAASQKRDTESALIGFITRTCKTHSLFNDDDTNLFPLISCDPAALRGTASYSTMAAMAAEPNAFLEVTSAEDMPILPSYVSGIMTCDHLFEEGDHEYLSRKKRRENDEDDIDTDEVQTDETGENETSEDNKEHADAETESADAESESADAESDKETENMNSFSNSELAAFPERQKNKRKSEEDSITQNPYLKLVRNPETDKDSAKCRLKRSGQSTDVKKI